VKAVQYEEFGGPLSVIDAPEPGLPPHGAIIEVRAAGMCRSDWHGWQHHDPDIVPPQIPGHEWAGVVVRVGDSVTRWRGGERVTAPFVCGCGSCEWCAKGDQQVCERQTQPGFTHGGAFAERLMVDHADLNLVALPDSVDFVTAASLGCRFATAFRAVAQQGRPGVGDWVAIHGCGGVGLSAVMVAVSAGARVVAVDISDDALTLAAELGAARCLNSSEFKGDAVRIGDAVRDMTVGGVALSLDAFGSLVTSAASVCSLRRRGRHVQVGVLAPAQGVPPYPMHRVMGWELEIVGSHGMSAHTYPAMLAAVTAGSLRPDRLVTRRVGLEDVCELLPQFSKPGGPGITVVEMPGESECRRP
jgi:D-arabinose 1-dehydrogenase-like Zn-dependent alcohol dehydrogenase